MIEIKPISSKKLEEYLAIQDLSVDPKKGEKAHAINLVYRKIRKALEELWPETEVRVIKRSPIVSGKDCYDNLLVPKDNISRSSTYTHWVDEDKCLQTHTSAQIPAVFRELAKNYDSWDDVTILVPGLAYRRDVWDKKHLGYSIKWIFGELLKTIKAKIKNADLLNMVTAIAKEVAPNWNLRIEDSPHPYTNEGIEVNATHPDGRDIEILECGLLGTEIIKLNGMDPEKVSGLAAGPGLDRLVMTLKDLPDIRLLRSDNPRIKEQMYDLKKYRPVSLQPAIKRDMSYSVPKNYVEEDISQDIENAIGDDISSLEEIELLSEVKYEDLPDVARVKLGINPNQKNVLVRITLRNLNKTLTKEEANKIYEKIYKKINKGEAGY